MSISPSRNASLPGSVAKSRGRVVFFTPPDELNNNNNNKQNINNRRNNITNPTNFAPGVIITGPVGLIRRNSLRKDSAKFSNSQINSINSHSQLQQQLQHQMMEEEYVPDIDLDDVLPLSLQVKEEMQMLIDEQEAYEEAQRKELLKKSVFAAETKITTTANTDNSNNTNQLTAAAAAPIVTVTDVVLPPIPASNLIVASATGSSSKKKSDAAVAAAATSPFDDYQKEHLTSSGSLLPDTPATTNNSAENYEKILYKHFMDVHSFRYALSDNLRKRYEEYEQNPLQKSRQGRRPLEFECTAEITDEFHGEDLEDHVRDAVLQERLEAQKMSFEATVSSVKAAQWDLEKLYFLATENSSDDSEGATEDVESEWRQETSQIYQTCRRLESSLITNCGEAAKKEEMERIKLEQEKAATDFVDMIKALHGYKCAPLLSAYSNAARTEQSMLEDNEHQTENNIDVEEAEEEEEEERSDEEEKIDSSQEALTNESFARNQEVLQAAKRAQERRKKFRERYTKLRGNTSMGKSIAAVSFTVSSKGGGGGGCGVKNKALDSLPQFHITPTERAMIWDALRKVYQFAEPVHAKRWLSATSRLYENPTFTAYQSVSTVSHIFFAAVHHLQDCLQPRVHDKLKRWANRCLYLIQRRSLTLNEFGVSLPTYKSVNVSCAGRSRDVPMETRRLPGILSIVAELHDHKLKTEKRAEKLKQRDVELEKRRVDFVAKYISANTVTGGMAHLQMIRSMRNAEKHQQMLVDADRAWEEYGKNAAMMEDDEDWLFFDTDDDDDDDDDDDGDDGQVDDDDDDEDDADEYNFPIEDENANNNRESARQTRGNSTSSSHEEGGGDHDRFSSSHASEDDGNKSASGESSARGKGSRRSSSAGRQQPLQKSKYSRRTSLASNVFQCGDRVVFDYAERKRLEEQRITKQKQMDPRKKKKEMRAMKRARMFSELKRNAMEERAQAELKAELLNYRADVLGM